MVAWSCNMGSGVRAGAPRDPTGRSSELVLGVLAGTGSGSVCPLKSGSEWGAPRDPTGRPSELALGVLVEAGSGSVCPPHQPVQV